MARTSDLKSGYVLVANQQSGSASLINLANDTAKVIPVGEGPHEAVISPSGRTGIVTIYGIAGKPGNQLAVIDIASGVVTKTISLGTYTRPHGANFLPGDESRVVVTSESTQNIVLVDLTKGEVLQATATTAAGSHMVATTADGSRAVTANITGGSISMFNLKPTPVLDRVIPTSPQTEGIAITPDGREVWAASNTGIVNIVNPVTSRIDKTLTGFGQPYRLAMSPDGKFAIICDPKGDKIAVADVATRAVVWTLDAIGSPRGVNIAPDGKTAFVTLAADETMGVIDLDTRKLTRKIKVEKSPDGVWYGPAPRR
ncbi:MAG: YncE family protein [Acidobacteria bacterium]|nr:YncE family protein [Acidobacteriota bacterium]